MNDELQHTIKLVFFSFFARGILLFLGYFSFKKMIGNTVDYNERVSDYYSENNITTVQVKDISETSVLNKTAKKETNYSDLLAIKDEVFLLIERLQYDEAVTVRKNTINNYNLDDFKDFENVFIDIRDYLLIVNGNNKIARKQAISNLKSPEMILYTYLKMTTQERAEIAKDDTTYVYDEKLLFNLRLIESIEEVGAITSGASRVFTNVTGFKSYCITFYDGELQCKLYYVLDNYNKCHLLGLKYDIENFVPTTVDLLK